MINKENKMTNLNDEYNPLDSLEFLKNLSTDRMIASVMPTLLICGQINYLIINIKYFKIN